MADYESTSLGIRGQEFVCTVCGLIKTHGAYKARHYKGSLYRDSTCRQCRNAQQREAYAASPERRARQAEANRASTIKRIARFEAEGMLSGLGPKRCPRCQTTKSPEHFYRNAAHTKRGLSSWCIPCTSESLKGYVKKSREELRKKDPIRFWARSVFGARRHAAREAGLPFNITVEDLIQIAVPVCPILGIPLEYGKARKVTRASASVDRFRPYLGYVPGNLRVVSQKANSMKNDASPMDLARLAAWCLQTASITEHERQEMQNLLLSAMKPLPTTAP